MRATEGYVLDTTVLILYARAGAAAEKLEEQFKLTQSPFRPVIAVVTLGEIRAFAYWRKWMAARLKKLDSLLAQLVVMDISSPEIIEAYAKLKAELLSTGRNPSRNDLWTAAVTHCLGLTLITADKDFDPLAGKHIQRILIAPDSGAIK